MFVLLSCEIFNQYFIEYQQAGLIHQLDSEMVESLFDVVSLCDSLARVEDLEFLEAQSEEKLRTQEIIKENDIDKVENSHMQKIT